MIDIATEEFVDESIDDALLENSPLIDELSASHIGNWNKLVSQTNWEKGAVILRWRNAMIAAELPRSAYSDEAWATRVGNVTAQHIGRLRRVAERFGSTAADYPNLYWSHFQAAFDWEDAEMWLEGAVQNDWSVAQMRSRRWEAIGAPESLKPQEHDIFTAEVDEDVNPRNDSPIMPRTAEINPTDSVEGFDATVPPVDVAAVPEKKKAKKSAEKTVGGPSTRELLDSLKDISELPDDLRDSLEALRVAILNHKIGGWKDVSAQKLLRLLDALKSLVTAADE
jgi:hypothetical protein